MASYKLLPARLQAADHYRARYGAIADIGTTMEDLERPEYWAHVAGKLKPLDTIDVFPEDSAWFAELLVISTGTGFAKVKLLRHVSLEDDDVGEGDGSGITEVKWRGPHRKHCVVRLSDDEVLRDGFSVKAEAQDWAREYERTVG